MLDKIPLSACLINVMNSSGHSTDPVALPLALLSSQNICIYVQFCPPFAFCLVTSFEYMLIHTLLLRVETFGHSYHTLSNDLTESRLITSTGFPICILCRHLLKKEYYCCRVCMLELYFCFTTFAAFQTVLLEGDGFPADSETPDLQICLCHHTSGSRLFWTH